MRTIRNLFAALAVAATTVIAAAPAKAHYESTYFPMHVGNEWSYSKARSAGTPQKVDVRCDASWVSSVTGQIWFRMRGYNGDWQWLKQTRTGRIYAWGERPLYRLGAGPGFPWKMDLDERIPGEIPCSDGAQLEVVSRSEQVTVPAGTFATIHIRFSSQCRDAGITDEWFAKGVGLVKRAETSIAGPIVASLDRAKISGRVIGGQTAPAVRTTVSTDHADYWENHMPGPGPRPTNGPEIKVSVVTHSSTSNDAVVNMIDPVNIWDVTIEDAQGTVVYANPKSRVMAPANGFNRTFTAAGTDATFSVRFPFGQLAQGTYKVKAKLLARVGTFPVVETSFGYGYAY